MTGADVNSRFSIKCDEVQSDYFDNTTRQAFCDEALLNIFQLNVDKFQVDRTITDDLRVFLKEATISTPTSNLIDISNSSTDVPDYYQVITLPRVTFVVDGVTYAGRATELKSSEVGGYFGQGTLYDPKYDTVNNKLRIRPLGYQCNEAIVSYIAVPTAIDLTDASTELPFPDKFINTIVSDMCELAGIPKKSQFDIQANQQQRQINP